MRCSSCEPLLDRYLEGTLTPREMVRVRAHLQSCERCASLLGEVRVIDALLATTKPIDLAPNFTFAVMAEARTLPIRTSRRPALWALLATYVAAAWIVVTGCYLAFGPHDARVDAARTAIAQTIVHTGFALSALTHGFGPAAPLVVGGVVTVLAVDLVLALFALFLYRAIRSRAQRPEAL